MDAQHRTEQDWLSWVAPLVLCALMIAGAALVVSVFAAGGGDMSQLWSPWWMPAGYAALVAAAFVVSCRRSMSWLLVATMMAITLSGSGDDFRSNPRWVSAMSTSMVTVAAMSAGLLVRRRRGVVRGEDLVE